MKFNWNKVKPSQEVDSSNWNSWSWQVAKSLKTKTEFENWVGPLEKSEAEAFTQGSELFRIQITPYYASLLKQTGLSDLRRIVVPLAQEIDEETQSQLDPLGERKNNPAPRIVHRYSDRCLFLITDFCSVYCRYCTRKHFTAGSRSAPLKSEYEQAIDYIRNTKGLREVILSGGDPLSVSDAFLDRVMTDLRSIDHIEIIRVGSRFPVVCPQRITPELCAILKKHKPVYFMTHFNHPDELTFEAAEALERLVDSGVPVFNQLVLLNGVNNHPALIQALSRRLLYLRVKPYYMFQCDPSRGTEHLRTSIDESLAIQKELWGHLSGLAMPQYSIDIPDGGGKTILTPNFQTEIKPTHRKFEGFDGVNSVYINPDSDQKLTPQGVAKYEAEWNELKLAKSNIVLNDSVEHFFD